MTANQSDIDSFYEDWMDDEVPQETQKLWQEAVTDYMNFHNIVKPEYMKFNVDLVRKMIKHVSVRDNRWKGFPEHTFSSAGMNAERSLYFAIKRKIDALTNESKKPKKEQLAKKQLEKIPQTAKPQAEQIIADQQLPKIPIAAIGNTIDISIAEKT